MTIWTPDIAGRTGPRYRAIAEALAAAVRDGVLAPGTRLPTHRDLAWRLKVTVGTVSRAYAEAERRGLIAGEVGRGTFVRGGAAPPALRQHAAPPGDDLVDLSVHRPRGPSETALTAAALQELAGAEDLAELIDYQPHAGRPADRAAGAAWIARTGGPAATPEQVLVTAGGQHAMTAVLAAVADPGDTIAVEALTYPGIRATAAMLRVRTLPLAMDEHGVVPDALAAACRARRIRAAYLLPSLHNPTAATLPLERRRRLAALAEQHDTLLIEDDLYGFLSAAPLPPLAALAPERAVYLTATSKCFVPGLRVGYLSCPAALVDRVAATIRATLYTAPPLMAALASRWIADGTADRLVAEKRAETAQRQEAARHLLPPGYRTTPEAAHLWLPLPEPWSGDEFAAAARRSGVAVTPASAFAAGGELPRAVRVCIGAPPSLAQLERGLLRLARLLSAAPQSDRAVV
jgi:DNA-binding transcriptional MocR family regulator